MTENLGHHLALEGATAAMAGRPQDSISRHHLASTPEQAMSRE